MASADPNTRPLVRAPQGRWEIARRKKEFYLAMANLAMLAMLILAIVVWSVQV